MHVARIITSRKGRSYDTYLIRQSYREGNQVKHRTIANLSALPLPVIETVQAMLRGEAVGPLAQAFEIERSLPHGHVAAVLGLVRQLGLDKLLAARPRRERELALAMIVSRVLQPDSKLATARGLGSTSLAGMLDVEGADEDELYAAMDWLLTRQPALEAALARRHLADGGLVLYDLTSVYLEGSKCELAKRGFSRDGKRGLPQIEFGLITNAEGCPVGVEVFEGNLADPMTVEAEVDKIKGRFGISQLVLVGDRGMLTSARIEALKAEGGVSWISALRAPQIAALINAGDLQLGLFDQRNLAEITSDRFPGERLVVCKNPALAEERARKRKELLEATEQELDKVVEAVKAGRLKAATAIAERVGRIIGRYKVGKHFVREVGERSFSYRRDQAKIEAEAALDGLYVIRSNVSPETLSDRDLVRSYKLLSRVERAFRTMKSVDLQVRPVHHRLADRVRAHILLCMLAYYVRWHLERRWAPLLYRDEQPPVVEDPVAPAERSASALDKARTGRCADGILVNSFSSLLAELATLTKNRVRLPGSEVTFEKLSLPTPVQAEALRLLGLAASL
ncbi:MAG TPA: IS1634 family transposase [Candidatus Dormibacteraeota bacterium]|jgi:transposase|nr:IS1634 family transposase [Candidatus Dormibacteraeota bacterium]